MSRTSFLAAVFCLCVATTVTAQTSSASAMTANAVPHTTVPFAIDDPGVKLPDIVWGLDAAWDWEWNVRRGVNWAGADLIDIMRLSFQTTSAVDDSYELSDAQKERLDWRISLARLAGNVTVNINSDQEAGVINHYIRQSIFQSESTIANRWYRLIKATKQYIERAGITVSSVSPFNEPDYSDWKQGSKECFKLIAKLIKEDASFNGVAVCGGNTLNNDQAMAWYTAARDYLDEGNTHQLAGSFDNFAAFYAQVAADGRVGVADELHNTMECMVASEYGLAKGIWWGTCDHTRSQFMRASRGTRMGYAENRSNWTAASVYRHPEGHVEGFGGSSERQATETTFRFAALDHDVWFNGHGPTREYLMTIPGGTAYQTGQTNAETMVRIQGDDDIMPPLPLEATTYKLFNRQSRLALGLSGNNTSSGTQVVQITPVTSSTAQRWVVTPVEARVGGDFSYYRITNVANNSLQLDVRDWSLIEGGTMLGWAGDGGDNEQWAFDYAGDGWFYIRSRHSGLCLQVEPGTTSQMSVSGRAITQAPIRGEACQQWRLLPANVSYDRFAPAAPAILKATALPAAVRLTWSRVKATDLSHYIVQRSADGTSWHTLHNKVTDTVYVDNTAHDGITYSYRILASDRSLNRSDASPTAICGSTGANAQICIVDTTLLDLSGHGNHAALAGTAALTDGPVGRAFQLDGSTQFMQLPATIANHDELTVALWVRWHGGGTWQRIMDCGTDTNHYFFITPDAGNGPRFAIKDGTTERNIQLGTAFPQNEWVHVALTFGLDAITVWLNGEPVAANTDISERPAAFSPVFNYVGRSQFRADPMLNADICGVTVFNYALSPESIQHLLTNTTGIDVPAAAMPRRATVHAFDLSGRRMQATAMRRGQICIMGGHKVVVK